MPSRAALRRSVAVFTLAFLLPLGAAAAPDGPAPLVLSDYPWPPFFLGPEAEQPGFAREILEICLEREGRPIESAELNIKRMFDALEAGQLDIHVMSHKPERERIVVYGREPLFSAVYRPVVRRGTELRIDELEDFDPLRIGHMDGLSYSPEFKAYLDGRIAARDRVETVSGDLQIDRLLQMLASGRIDVMVNMTITVRRTARDLGLRDRIRILDREIKRSDYFVVASRTSPRIGDPEELLGRIDDCVRDLRASGRYAELEESYGFGEGPADGP